MATANSNAATKGSTCAADMERINGAKECIAALMELERSAENLPESANDAAVYAAIQSGDAEHLAAQFGPLTPRQEGAFRVLAEYIHATASTGTPNLEVWTPFVANTPEEVADWANRIFDEEVAA